MASFLFETYLMVGQGLLDLLEMDMHYFNENLPNEAYFTQGRGHCAVGLPKIFGVSIFKLHS